MNSLEVARVVAEGWRKLDASVISEVLADNVTYTSMWVFQTLEGKAAYLEYLTRKFETMRKSGTGPIPTVAHMNMELLDSGEYAVFLRQGKVDTLLVMHFVTDGDKTLVDRLCMSEPTLFNFELIQD